MKNRKREICTSLEPSSLRGDCFAAEFYAWSLTGVLGDLIVNRPNCLTRR
jgi:hypothetical protein